MPQKETMSIDRQHEVAGVLAQLEKQKDGPDWLLDLFNRFTVGVFWVDCDLKHVPQVLTGSGVLFEHDGGHFVATCSHVLRAPSEMEKPRLRLYHNEVAFLRGPSSELVARYALQENKDDERGSDAGMIQLHDHFAQHLKTLGFRFATKAEVCQGPDPECPFFAFGFPQAEHPDPTPHNDAQGKVVRYEFSSRIAECQFAGSTEDERRWRFALRGDVWPSGLNPLLSTSGMSGGGVWQLGLKMEPNGWTAGPPRLVGLVESRRGKLHPELFAEKIGAWIDDLDTLLARDG